MPSHKKCDILIEKGDKDMTLFLLYWLISGTTALFIGIKNAKGPENTKKVEDFARDFNISERRTVVIFYASFFLLGFIALPVVMLRKLVGIIRH